jgi:hypothetical protein
MNLAGLFNTKGLLGGAVFGPLGALGGAASGGAFKGLTRGGVNPIGQHLGDFLGFGAEQEKNRALQEALSGFDNINLPDIQSGGLYDLPPELQLLGEIGNLDTAADNDVQKEILSRLQDLSRTGTTAQGEADRSKFLTQEGVRTKGIRDAILQRQASQGISGSGASLLDQLTNSQNSATLGNQNSLQRASDLERSRIGAMGQASDLDFRRSSAQDSINRFNQSNQIDRMVMNNNLTNDSNTRQWTTGNTNKDLQRQLNQQQYENEMARQSGRAGLQIQMSQNRADNFQNIQNRYNNQFQNNQNYYRQQANVDRDFWYNAAKDGARAGAGAFGTPGGGSGGAASGGMNRYAGGPVETEKPYIVGEIAEETYLPKNGLPMPIGSDGPEFFSPPEDGQVLNHEDTKHVKDFMNLLSGNKYNYRGFDNA